MFDPLPPWWNKNQQSLLGANLRPSAGQNGVFIPPWNHEGIYYGCQPKKNGYPKMDGLYGKTLLKWMIWGYPYFWKHPYTPRNFPHMSGQGVLCYAFARIKDCEHLGMRFYKRKESEQLKIIINYYYLWWFQQFFCLLKVIFYILPWVNHQHGIHHHLGNMFGSLFSIRIFQSRKSTKRICWKF